MIRNALGYLAFAAFAWWLWSGAGVPDALGVMISIFVVSCPCALGVAVPDSPMRSARLMDGSRWDGSDPAAYARSFSLHALADRAAVAS